MEIRRVLVLLICSTFCLAYFPQEEHPNGDTLLSCFLSAEVVTTDPVESSFTVSDMVHMSFLYVGHTHEDIDASFSKISEKLRTTDAETVPQLLNLVRNIEDLSTLKLWDVKSWLESSLTKVKGVSEPLHFKITKTSGKIKVVYKGQQHQLWTVLDGRGTFLRNLPTSKIKQLKPNYKNILEKIETVKKQISAISYMFESSENHLWWKAFLEKINTVMPMRTKEDIIWITQLPKQQKKQQRNIKDNLDPILRKMLEKETLKVDLCYPVKKDEI